MIIISFVQNNILCEVVVPNTQVLSVLVGLLENAAVEFKVIDSSGNKLTQDGFGWGGFAFWDSRK